MVDFRNSISVCKSFDSSTDMSTPLHATDAYANSRQNHQLHRNRKQINSSNPLRSSPCHRSRTAAVDVVILVIVICACAFLIFPYIRLFFHGIVQIGGVTITVVRGEVCRSPLVYAFLGSSVIFAAIAFWGISKCLSRKCGKPNCRGLREAAEFDIQIETEECVKNSTSTVEDDSGWGLFELSRDHHKELEAELKKIAPPNGRAVLVFRASCGCSVGKMEVPGPRKNRKSKK